MPQPDEQLDKPLIVITTDSMRLGKDDALLALEVDTDHPSTWNSVAADEIDELLRLARILDAFEDLAQKRRIADTCREVALKGRGS